ncbi:MAG: AraC family transcriptional regulator [Candidatus Melainabacteria bacterium]|nr:MAG: AraC family transcriptional regulator [Candidatus Melainabacteria bacterium]
MGKSKSKTIAVLALPGVQLLDVCGPLDVFAEANRQAERHVYTLTVISTDRKAGPIRSSSGISILADYTMRDEIEPIDTLLVAGCPDLPERIVGDKTLASLYEWLRATVPSVRRFGSVCSGALILAQAGLLDKKRVTTHWAVAERLQTKHPKVNVEPDAIHIRDGKVRTAAGVTAGLDLALALVEEDLGRDIAMAVANQLVMYFKRPGGQLQFSRKGEAKPAGRSALQEVQRYIAANPAEDHSVARLAARLDLSERHFARLFHNEVGVTPAAWVEQVRIDVARRLLENNATPKQVATQCGFADVDTLRRAFVRQVGVTPASYQKNYR